MKKLIIAIDPGARKHPSRNNGFAVWDTQAKDFNEISTLYVHEVIFRIEEYMDDSEVFVRLEDARLSKHKRNEKHKIGAGYVMAAVNVLEAYLKERKIPFQLVRPNAIFCSQNANGKKSYYWQITGRNDGPSEHARIAALYAHGFKFPHKNLKKILAHG